ncbi:MAG: hypothetical protein M3P87_05430 [Actinomycetota bacterium]|nr:hypothetical protein [Actinomycetota bacterium]
MSSFDARLRLPGQTRLPLAVEVDISQERMRLTAGDETVADWPLEGLDVVARSDGFHITVDEEKVVLSVAESTRFAKELGLPPKPVRRPPVAKDERGSPTESPAVAASPGGAGDATAKHRASPVTDLTEDGLRFQEVRVRIDEVATALTSNSMSPAEAFARWLELLKEINRELAQGSMPSDVFFELNTRLLDLIPAATVSDP